MRVMADERIQHELVQLELFSKQFYTTADQIERQKAEVALAAFASSPDCLTKCQLLLERGDSAYAQLLAATTLTKLVSKTPCPLSVQQRVGIRNYILRYLASDKKLETFAIQGLVQLYARIAKVGWFDADGDNFVFRDVVPQIREFIDIKTRPVEYCVIGVQLLSQLTCEINQTSGNEASRSITKQRKIASSFRDTHLYDIFQISHELLRHVLEQAVKMSQTFDHNQQNLISNLLKLAYNCLNFDFIGTSPDESSDDLSTVQIPTSWRPAFLDFNTIQLFFDLYHALPPPLASIALQALVQIASVRRSLFNNTERAKFLLQLVAGVKYILEHPQGLSDPSCYHEFCRLLARLKSNYQLSELVKVEGYPDTIALITNFTVQSLRMWSFSPNSIHYLLSLWQRMVASVPYVKSSEPHLLETYTPQVTRAYITSRLESVTTVVQEGLEDQFDDIGMVQQQLDQLSTICRCEYENTCTLIVELFDQSAKGYEEVLRNGQTANSAIQLSILEGQLTWLVYIIGAAIGGRVFLNSTDEHDEMDGELAARVLKLMNLTDQRLASGGFCEKLELSLLSFIEQFRKIYTGDQVQKTSKVFKKLSELCLSEETMVLSIFVGKIITNLKYWSNSEVIISKTLQLLNDLSVGYSSVRKLVKLEAVQFILNHHTSEHFPFLGNSSQITDLRCRSTFYTSLGRLLMIDLGEDEEKFDQFMLPLTSQMEYLGNLLLNQSSNGRMYNEEETKKSLIGIVRDLRGLAFAFNTKSSYMMLFDWIYPSYTPILHRSIELWYHDPQVTTPVLKFMSELVMNRSQRLQFDVSSPNGILFFRETSKMIFNYGSRILTLTDIPKESVYPLKLKGVSTCFSILKSALCGGYVNFGVFRLYHDAALDDALGIFVKLVLSIPQHDLLTYPKLSQTFYVLLECIAQDHMNFLASLEPSVFLYILSSISEGLNALDTMVCTGCCATLDHIVSYIFRWISKSSKKSSPIVLNHVVTSREGQACLKVLEMHPEILQQMLSTILNIIMFEDCRNQWSMSRPLLGLILLNEDYFRQVRQQIIASQPVDIQANMTVWFDNLMDGVERNLLTKNRDRFTQNLSVFRRDINESLKGPSLLNNNSSSVSISQGDMMN